jgi:hypothetical protein
MQPQFRTSSFSGANGSCVAAAGVTWRKSGRSGPTGGNCVLAAGVTFEPSSASAGGNCAVAAGVDFATSSESGDSNCVLAAGASFTTSSESMNGGSCLKAAGITELDGVTTVWMLQDSKVELTVKRAADLLGIHGPERDALIAAIPHLHYPAPEWNRGLGVEFQQLAEADVDPVLLDIARERGQHKHQEWFMVTREGEPETRLQFTRSEMEAWLLGVVNSEFTRPQLITAAA